MSSTTKFLDLWLPLGVVAGSVAVFVSHSHRGIYPDISGLVLIGLFLAVVAVVCGTLAGLIAALVERSLKFGLWIFYTVTLGLWIFMVAGAALASLGNRPIPPPAVPVQLSDRLDINFDTGFEDAFKMLLGSAVGTFFGLWWGIARGVARLRQRGAERNLT
jgi:hypothetical protein